MTIYLSPGTEPLELFISFTSEDEKHRAALEIHLAPLVREGILRIWHTGKTGVGESLDVTTSARLGAMRMFMPLVSSSYLASDEAMRQAEVALRRRDLGEVTVIPLIVRTCRWKPGPFADLVSLPRNEKPVTRWQDKDSAWTHVAEEIRSAAINLAPTPAPQQPARPDDPDEIDFWRTSKLIKESLPAILAGIVPYPHPIFSKADIPATIGQGGKALEKWTHACKWMSESGMQGIESAVRVVSDVQSNAFSEELSRWNYGFVHTVLLESRRCAPSVAGVLPLLRRLVCEEARRWYVLKTEMDSMFHSIGNTANRASFFSSQQHARYCMWIWAQTETDISWVQAEDDPGQYRLSKESVDVPWPTTPDDFNGTLDSFRDRLRERARADEADGVDPSALVRRFGKIRLRSSVPITVDELKEVSAQLGRLVGDIADSGYFDEGELSEHELELNALTSSLEYRDPDHGFRSMGDSMKRLLSSLDWIEALLHGRLRNCVQT